MTRRRTPRPLAALVLGTLGAAIAQEPVTLTTGDGSRFLLVRIESPVIHWVHLQPALDEPVGLQGLALAVTRATLAAPGSGAADPLSWEKSLRRAPSSGSRLVEVEGHLGVAVGFPPASLKKVAALLQARTRRPDLQGVQQHLDAIRAARRERLRHTPHLAAMRRLCAAAAKPLAHVLADHATVAVDEETVLDYYRRSYAPALGLHVLTGAFDPAAVADVLRRAFERPAPPPPADFNPPDRLVPMSRDVPEATDTVLFGFPLPSSRDAVGLAALDLLVQVLAGDDDAWLPEQLRAAGHPGVIVRAEAPFPGPGGVLMVAVTDPGSTVTEKSPLIARTAVALGALIAAAPDEARLLRAKAALQAERTRALRHPEGLALLLARQWARTGAPPRDLAPEARIAAGTFHAVARAILRSGAQTVVAPRAATDTRPAEKGR